MIENDGKLSKKELINKFGEFLDLIKNGELKDCEPITRDFKGYMKRKHYDTGSSQRIGKIISDSKKFKWKRKYSKRHKNTFNYYERKE